MVIPVSDLNSSHSSKVDSTTLDHRSFILHEAWMKEDWQAVKDQFSKNGQNGCIAVNVGGLW